jgi:hypothetical protein
VLFKCVAQFCVAKPSSQSNLAGDASQVQSNGTKSQQKSERRVFNRIIEAHYQNVLSGK